MPDISNVVTLRAAPTTTFTSGRLPILKPSFSPSPGASVHSRGNVLPAYGVQSILPAGTAGHGLPSGQIWALNFEPLWATLDASETLVVATKNAIDTEPKTNVCTAFFRIGYTNSRRFADAYLAYVILPNANLTINTVTKYLGLLSQVMP